MKLLITGANGRIGKAIMQYLSQQPNLGLKLVVGLTRESSPAQKQDDGASGSKYSITYTDDLDKGLVEADVVIDFTSPAYSLVVAKACAQHKTILVCGTTGFSDSQQQTLSIMAKEIPLFLAPNMSVGVSVFAQLIRKAARALEEGFDIEIVEKHHRDKLDVPSGTALMLANAAGEARSHKISTAQELVIGRHEHKKRGFGEIGVSSVRGGRITGEHEVIFAGEYESISLVHKAYDRVIYVEGALKAAKYMLGKPAGKIYNMDDLLQDQQSRIF